MDRHCQGLGLGRRSKVSGEKIPIFGNSLALALENV